MPKQSKVQHLNEVSAIALEFASMVAMLLVVLSSIELNQTDFGNPGREKFVYQYCNTVYPLSKSAAFCSVDLRLLTTLQLSAALMGPREANAP